MKKRRIIMNKYSEIETKTAKNLLEKGFKWIARDSTKYGNCLYAYTLKPNKDYLNGKDAVCWRLPYDRYGVRDCVSVCSEVIPIFQSVCSNDKEPTSLENIVHPQILDDAERRYLSAVIKPFRNDVTEIRKRICKPYEYLRINGRFNNGINYFFLPNFDAGTMYKGMESDRWYTLEELGL